MAEHDKDEWADDLTPEQIAWIKETEKSSDEFEAKLESGEIDKEVINPWTSENWQAKARGGTREDVG